MPEGRSRGGDNDVSLQVSTYHCLHNSFRHNQWKSSFFDSLSQHALVRLHHSLFDITKQLRVQTFCSMLERLCKFFIVLMPSGLVSIQYIQQNSCKMARLPSITDIKTALS